MLKPDQLHPCDALVDTGATRTCIAKSVAESLDIKPIGKTKMQTASHSIIETNEYYIKLVLFFQSKTAADGSVQSNGLLLPSTLPVLEFEAGTSRYQALIGRDVLRGGLLTMSPDQHFSFAI